MHCYNLQVGGSLCVCSTRNTLTRDGETQVEEEAEWAFKCGSCELRLVSVLVDRLSSSIRDLNILYFIVLRKRRMEKKIELKRKRNRKLQSQRGKEFKKDQR